MNMLGSIHAVETGYHFCTFWVESQSLPGAGQRTSQDQDRRAPALHTPGPQALLAGWGTAMQTQIELMGFEGRDGPSPFNLYF